MNEKTLHKISYGVYIISSKNNDKLNGQIANALFQVTAQPQTIAMSINKQNLTHEFIQKSKVFSVSILSEQTPMSFIGTFGFKSGRNIDKFKDINYKIGKTGAPIVLDHSFAYFEGSIINHIDIGTHTIFIGKIEDAEILSNEKPMTYAYYHEIKGGISPKTAPTYSGTADTTKKKEELKMNKYVCTVCGYEYDPEKGDPDADIPAGTPFEKLPDTWVCPVCGAGKDAFEIQ
jgi:flavin reductase (DIM6/NTAB) family NADH-FMN oxidoreductase RutF/rubredoxin